MCPAYLLIKSCDICNMVQLTGLLGEQYLELFLLKPDFSGEKLPRTGPTFPAIFLRSRNSDHILYFIS